MTYLFDLEKAASLRVKAMRYVFSRGFRKALLIALIFTTVLLVSFILLQRTASGIDVSDTDNTFNKESLPDAVVEDLADTPRRKPMKAGRQKPQSEWKPADQRSKDTFLEAVELSKDRKTQYNLGLHDENCNAWRNDKINIHLIPHSHDDVGWLKTVDQYYWGDLNYIQNAGVQYIIDSVLSEVARQPDRRFVIVEMAFLWRWWRRQNEASRNLLRRLIERGQIELICAGWSMADEASVDYVSLIDQHTTGFGFITSEIDPNYRPLIGWQIDPFGHSREVASLFAEMGMNGLFFARLDYQERAHREQQRTSEMVWQLRPKSPEMNLNLFTSLLARSNYSPPPGFNFETFTSDQPVMDDPNLDGYNVPMRVAQFEQSMNLQRTQFPTRHLMVTMGMDFNYVNAVPWFSNMDALIRGMNNRSSTYHMLYSSPSCYTRAVYESVDALTNKTDDFFPYADKPQAYWTGYFTSRPSLKKLVRDLTNVYTATRQLLAFSETPIDKQMRDRLHYMQDAQGILQHHDAVTGTAKQAVTDDYRKRASLAMAHGRVMIDSVLRELHCGGKEGYCRLSMLHFCPLLNETQCEFSEQNPRMAVVAYNQLAESSSTWVRVPVSQASMNMQVLCPSGEVIPADIVPLSEAVKSVPTRQKSKATHEIVFKVEMPPLGSSVYFIEIGDNVSQTSTLASSSPFASAVNSAPNGAATQSNGKTVVFDGRTIDNGRLKLSVDDKGRLNSLENRDERIKIELTHFLAFYAARGMPSPPSGAYLFNPDTKEPHLFTEEPETTVVVGSQVVELHHKYSTWAKSIIRVYANESQLEVQWIAGPIPTEAGTIDQLNRAAMNTRSQPNHSWQWGGGGGIGREVVSVFESSINNKKVFYTDSNGREMIERVKDFRPSWSLQTTEPVSQNYYPLNGRISMNDSNAQMTLVVDRAQGGTGMRDGQLEVMVHRRLVQDDQLGVGEALQEIENGRPLVATGRHWLMLNSPKNAAKAYRKFGQKVLFPETLAFSAFSSRDEWLKKSLKTVTSLGQEVKSTKLRALLPENINLLTLERNFLDCNMLIRLEHLFEGGEDEKLALPQTVQFAKLVKALVGADFTIEERALGANMPIKDLVRLHWATKQKGPGFANFHTNNFGQSQNVVAGGLPVPVGEYEQREESQFQDQQNQQMMMQGRKRRDASPVEQGETSSKPLRYDQLGQRVLHQWTSDTVQWQTITLLPMQIRTFCIRSRT